MTLKSNIDSFLHFALIQQKNRLWPEKNEIYNGCSYFERYVFIIISRTWTTSLQKRFFTHCWLEHHKLLLETFLFRFRRRFEKSRQKKWWSKYWSLTTSIDLILSLSSISSNNVTSQRQRLLDFFSKII